MGEKGIGGAAVAATMPAASSLIERTTTSVVTTATDAGFDLIATVQDKTVGAFADEAISAARERLTGDEAAVTPVQTEIEAEAEDPQGEHP
ncbi:MAG: hypothetical protein ABIO83_08005 [Ilumatobacteraceae bacterium]